MPGLVWPDGQGLVEDGDQFEGFCIDLCGLSCPGVIEEKVSKVLEHVCKEVLEEKQLTTPVGGGVISKLTNTELGDKFGEEDMCKGVIEETHAATVVGEEITSLTDIKLYDYFAAGYDSESEKMREIDVILTHVTGEISSIMDNKPSDFRDVSGHDKESGVEEKEEYIEELSGYGVGEGAGETTPVSDTMLGNFTNSVKSPFYRSTGWLTFRGHGLFGGGGFKEGGEGYKEGEKYGAGKPKDEENDGEGRSKQEVKDVGKLTKQLSVTHKRKLTIKEVEESPTKRRRLVVEYKQRTPKKSPLKTPTTRKTPRLKCRNIFCRIGFSSQKAKLFHERFQCSFNEPKSVSPAFSPALKDDCVCRFCDMVFSASRSRHRHEKKLHQKCQSRTSSFIGSKHSDVSVRDESPASSSSGML